MKTPAPNYAEALQDEIVFDGLIETAMRPYSMEELRELRDDLVEQLRKDSPSGTGALLAQLARSAPRQEAAAFAALLAATIGRPALRKRLGVLRTLSAYIHARELAASPGARDLPPPQRLRWLRSRSSRHCCRSSSALNPNPKNPQHERTNRH